jgi:hypothetical protein
MSTWDDNDDDFTGQSGSELRKQYEKALKKLKAIESERDALVAEKAQASASQALQAKGYNPSVARFAAADGVNLGDEAALQKWLDDNKDVFKPVATQSTEEQVADEPVDEPAFTGDVENAFAAMQRVHSTGSNDLRNKYEAAMAGLKDDASPEEVAALFREKGL